MIRRILFVLLALTALAAPARAKDELVIGMTQSPGTWNPLISSMLAKSLISNMTSRPLTAWNADWKLVCHRLHRSADHRERQGAGDRPSRRQEEHGGRPRAARPEMGRRHPGHREGRRLHPGGRPPSAVRRGLVGRLPAHHQVRRQGRPSLHHDDRPRHLRLQPHRAAASCRRTSRSRSSRPIPPSTATRRRSTPTRPTPACSSVRSASSRSCPATASSWSRTRPGRARSPTSSASSSRSSRTPRHSRPTCCRATSTTCWASSACRSTRCWPSRSATRTSTTSSTSRR